MTETELTDRLERLERDNRRLKRLATFALVIAAALGAIYAARPVPQKITAHEFDVVDATGKVRAKVAMDCSIPKDCWPAISLFDANAKPLTLIGAGTLTVSGEKGQTTLLGNDIQIRDTPNGKWSGASANLGVDFMWSGAALTLTGREGISVQLMAQSQLPGGEGGVLNLMGKDGKSIYLDSDSPLIEIADRKGPYMDLGRTELTAPRTGATEQTSAASITMFGNDKKHHVIWKAP